MVLLCSTHLCIHYPFFRNQNGALLLTQNKSKSKQKSVSCFCGSSNEKRTSQNGFFSKREILLLGLTSSSIYSLSSLSPSGSLCLAEEDVKMASLVDEINAYTYQYPVELPSKKFLFKWVESRKPERYSSAAPLSPDARLRIVSERVDIIDNLIISVTIGPPNTLFLKSKDKDTWTAKDVADSVLSDKSALVDGEPYWYYEYLVRKSPTKIAKESNVFRHYIASTAERDGYLYTINASTLNKQWDKMGPYLEKTVGSFHLLPPTNEYVPPYKDPWRFW